MNIIEIWKEERVKDCKESIADLIGNGIDRDKAIKMVLDSTLLSKKYKDTIKNSFK